MKKKIKLSPVQLIGLGFAAIILLGALLLMLPISTRDGNISFLNALFTATSATCVTGLVVFDTYTKFTLFGQIVLLCLIQIGGLGFITLAMMLVVFSGKKIGLKSRTFLAEAVSSGQVGGVVRYTKMIVLGTAAIEGIGAVLLSFKFVPMFGFKSGVWCGIFHSVSAFCNAGFDILGRIEPGSSLTSFQSDPYVILVISALIIVGGIGFFVWNDVKENGLKFKKFRLHTKIMIVATLLLLTVPTILFVITEWNGVYKDFTFGEKLLNGFFQSVTTRTAGFNSTDYTAYSPAGYALSILLMIIGAGAGSTGGGMKVTTFAILLLSVKSYVVGTEDINVYGRRIDKETVRKAFTGALLFVTIMLLGAYVIMAFQGIGVEVALFESASAMGTVGLSSGITSGLEVIPKIAVIIMMYCGRVGSVSLAMSIVRKSKLSKIKYPEEKIIAG